MKNKKESRDSSIELLRLVLMVMICMHHCIVHGLGLAGLSNIFNYDIKILDEQMLITNIFNSLCIPAVNCFILISGYFSIKTGYRKILLFIFTIFFYSLPLNIVPELIKHTEAKEYLNAMCDPLFLSHSPYWFVTNYLFLMILSPLLNLVFEKLKISEIRTIIIGIAIMSCWFGFIWQHNVNETGYTLMQFILMYCIGRYIKCFNLIMSSKKAMITWVICSLIVAILMWTLWSHDKFNLAWRMTFYNNPLVIMASIGLFFLFRNFHFQSNTINKISKSTFAIYLFESSIFISAFIYQGVDKIYLAIGQNLTIFIIIPIIAIVTAICAIIIDRLRLRLIDYISFGNKLLTANN